MKREIKFGENLKLLRLQTGMTQEDIGKVVNAERQTVSSWETGNVLPNIEILVLLCDFFKVSERQMLYGSVIKRSYVEGVLRDWPPIGDYIQVASIQHAGFYTILEEDIQAICPGEKLQFGHIMAIAISVKKRGYKVTEVFMNGFSVYLKTDDQAKEFAKLMRGLVDEFMHQDNEELENDMRRYEAIVSKVKGEIIDDVMSKIYKKDIRKCKFYWVDDLDCLRGYGLSEEACKRQAREQKCVQYTIAPNVGETKRRDN